MKTQRFRVLKQLALFALAGPPVGGLAFLLWARIAGQPPLPFEPAMWLYVMFPAAYLLGGVPALITGAMAAFARAEAPGATTGDLAIRFTVPVAFGALFSVAFSLLTIASEPSLLLAAIGALSAFVCTLLAEWRESVRPNISFKPNPLRRFVEKCRRWLPFHSRSARCGSA